MQSSSIIKAFTGRAQTRPGLRNKLFFGRVSEDGAPYRGPAPPMYTDEEYEARVVRVGEPHAETFDLSDPKQTEKYLNVLNGCVNGAFQCLFVERYRSPKNPRRWYARIEWVEFYMEDGTPAPFMPPGMMEQNGGQANFFGHTQ